MNSPTIKLTEHIFNEILAKYVFYARPLAMSLYTEKLASKFGRPEDYGLELTGVTGAIAS